MHIFTIGTMYLSILASSLLNWYADCFTLTNIVSLLVRVKVYCQDSVEKFLMQSPGVPLQ